jgi:hypothetical protein
VQGLGQDAVQDIPFMATTAETFPFANVSASGRIKSVMPSLNPLNDMNGSAPGTVVNKSLQRFTREDFRRVAAQVRFLACFSATLNASRSSRVAKIDRQQHYRWLRDDPTYPGRFKEAMQMGIRTLEDHAVKLAHEGVKRMVTYKGKPVVYRGQVVYETEFDSQLIMFLLKNYDRKRFGDKIDTIFGPNWSGIPGQRSLMELMRAHQFGRTENMAVRAGEPILNSD